MQYRMKLIRAGRILLDGGGMFGIIPRVVWNRSIECDDLHRITLSHNCLFLESTATDPALGRPRRIIIETGTGDKLDAKMSKIFALDGVTIHSALAEVDIDPATIDDVIVTHLHFDHAGGLTRRCREGETADWTVPGDAPSHASGDAREIKLTFPNARVHVQRREWLDATANNSVMTRTYYRDHLDPLELPLPDGSARLVLADSPPPFPPGERIARDQLPTLSAVERASEILPGVRVFNVPGHTWGQQAVLFQDNRGRDIVFTPDVMPTRHHVGSAYSLAYDVEPYTSMLSRHWLLRDASSHAWTLVLDHEAGHPFVGVEPDSKGWFSLADADIP